MISLKTTYLDTAVTFNDSTLPDSNHIFTMQVFQQKAREIVNLSGGLNRLKFLSARFSSKYENNEEPVREPEHWKRPIHKELNACMIIAHKVVLDCNTSDDVE